MFCCCTCRRELHRLQECAEGDKPGQQPIRDIHMLDIGTGTGLLAMMAARYGQHHIADNKTLGENQLQLLPTALLPLSLVATA